MAIPRLPLLALLSHTLSHRCESLINFSHAKLSQGTSLVAQIVKCLPTMRETRVQSLGWEDLLEKEMTTRFSILA